MARVWLGGSPMHAILFGLKRAHHASLTVSRQLLRPFRLTPARFDLLCALSQHECLAVADLANVLGVKSRPTSKTNFGELRSFRQTAP